MISTVRRWLKIRAGTFPKSAHNCIIDSTCTFSNVNNLILGNWVHIGPRSFLSAESGIHIGDGTILSSWVTILSSQHDYRNIDTVPYGGPNILKSVKIGKGVWIGYGAIILPGVSIGDGAIVGAGAVVTRPVDAGAVVAGNPAKVIQQRPDNGWQELINNESFLLKKKLLGK